MKTLFTIAAVLALLGLLLIPLPGPGFLVLFLAVPPALAGVALLALRRR